MATTTEPETAEVNLIDEMVENMACLKHYLDEMNDGDRGKQMDNAYEAYYCAMELKADAMEILKDLRKAFNLSDVMVKAWAKKQDETAQRHEK